MRFTEYLETLIVNYQCYRELGGPSPMDSTAKLDAASPSEETPPRWLVRMIEVGVAFNGLLPQELESVCARFNALRAREAALTDAMICHWKQLASHRRRDEAAIKHWRREERAAWNEYARQDRRRQLFERTREYRSGMDKLAEMLGGGS